MDSRTIDDMATAYLYLLLVQVKGFNNRTFLVMKSELPSCQKHLLLSVRFSRHGRKRVVEVKKKWAKESRGKKGRLKKGIELALLYKCKFKIH